MDLGFARLKVKSRKSMSNERKAKREQGCNDEDEDDEINDKNSRF